MKHLVYLILIFLVLPLTKLNAQISTGGEPLSWSNSSIPEMSESEVLGFVNEENLKAEDAIESQHKDIPLRFAYGHDVNYTTDNSGEWFVLNNGDKVWRLQLKSKGALSMNVTFSNYHIPAGAKLFIYSSDKSYKIGAFTNFNNKESGFLGTAPVPGDEIIVEYYEPTNVAFEGVLEIETVAHAYRDIFKLANSISKGKSFGDSGDCNNNVICEEAEEWEAQIRSVAMITLGNGTRWCTGSLLNNVEEDETPYFLTANHCIEGQNISTWVFIFNYFSDICDPGGSGNDGSILESVSGSTLLANTFSNGSTSSTDSTDTDMALLLLDDLLPESYDVFYNGWDWSGIAPPNTVGIHHPSGDVKKISWDDDAPLITGYFDETPTGSLGGTTHWRILEWDDGTTEGGSSGSPLYNDSKQVIGQLHGGTASCGNNIDDYYGRLELSFQFMQPWLDPDSTGVTSINGFPEPVILGTDPGLLPIQGIEASYCNQNTISPIILLKNYGLSEITAVDIEYFLDGNLEGTYSWTGSLQNGESESVEIEELTISASGTHTFSAEFSYDDEENLLNNQRDIEFYSIIGGIVLNIDILTDNYPNETTWAVYSMNGETLASGGPYGSNQFETLIEEEACIPDTCVEFVIYDSANDGICCGYGEGEYSVSYYGVELAYGGEFGHSESTVICPNLIDAIDEVNPLNKLKVYPNPANDRLFVDLKNVNIDDLEIRMSSIIGQQLEIENMSNNPSIIELNVQGYPKGMYVIEIFSNSFTKSFKVIIE